MVNFLLHQDVKDYFFLTPGRWSYLSCLKCQSVFLSSPISREELKRAYSNYYTHEKIEDKFYFATFFDKFKSRLKNWAFKKFAKAEDKKFLYEVFASLFPSFRSLPKPFGKRNLLDIGCGNGSFLITAKNLGWNAYGIDIDEEAINYGKKQNLNVSCETVSEILNRGEKFEVVTLNHVIEHIINPRYFLKECFDLIEANGFLWLETPNPNSFGHSIFRSFWRGLEPPRHLCLLSKQAITSILFEVGFSDIKFCFRSFSGRYTFPQSLQVKFCQSAHLFYYFFAFFLETATYCLPQKGEFITLLAKKNSPT